LAGTSPYVRVAVSAPLDEPLTYAWPEAETSEPQPGLRVMVPLRGRLATGFVLGPEERPPEGVRIKEVARVVDPRPLFPAKMMDLFRWLSSYYRHPLGQVMAAAIPSVHSGRPARSKQEKSARALPEADPERMARLGPTQGRLLAFLEGKGWLPFRIIRRAVPGADSASRGLAAKGLIEIRYQETALEPGSFLAPEGPPPRLTPSQRAALEGIMAARAENRFSPFLLHGVTGSGKTEVYLRAGQATLEKGRTAIILVPEIALTPSLAAQFEARFGDLVAILHSGLTPAQRVGEWLRLLSGQARLVLGARSAIFAPLTKVGLIVVDEEHETSYKQEEGLRYQARDVALVRGRMEGAAVILGSATPSVVSHYHRSKGKYQGLNLPTRVLSRPLPQVEMVDLRAEPEPPEGPLLFSGRLLRATEEVLAQGRQALFFINRRGFASYPVCGSCGRPYSCPNCSVTLTFHSGFGVLICHYCGLVQAAPQCRGCGSENPRHLGSGTERVEAEAKTSFPGARIARLDSDVSGGYRALSGTLSRLAQGKIDILVGTQMLAKGHDFPGIGLVGVILADQSLNQPDFRAAERTFQLLTQVSGRAGRGDAPGRVLIQTYNPDHYALVTSAAQDYQGFVDLELQFRRELFYPPFSRLILLRLSGLKAEAVERAARRVAAILREEARSLAGRGRLKILGPAPAPVVKVRNRFRWRVLIKARTAALGRALLEPVLDRAAGLEDLRRVRLAVDVDPINMI